MSETGEFAIIHMHSREHMQRRNPKCEVLAKNQMACGRNAIAIVIDTSPNFLTETKGCNVCLFHYNTLEAAAKRYGAKIIEGIEENGNNAETTTSNPEPTDNDNTGS